MTGGPLPARNRGPDTTGEMSTLRPTNPTSRIKGMVKDIVSTAETTKSPATPKDVAGLLVPQKRETGFEPATLSLGS
jgi:hypothetical protein